MTDRASCWSITINNPSDDEVKVTMPPGWALSGQYEKGEKGTLHFQGMLKTPQIRQSAVKRLFPRAHIEMARNKKALSQYVNKEETRVAAFEGNDSPNIFAYQDKVAAKWDWETWHSEYSAEDIIKLYKGDVDKAAMAYIDRIAGDMIEDGAVGLEFISVNPIWRSSWIKFWRSILARYTRKIETEKNATNSITPNEGFRSADCVSSTGACEGAEASPPPLPQGEDDICEEGVGDCCEKGRD